MNQSQTTVKINNTQIIKKAKEQIFEHDNDPTIWGISSKNEIIDDLKQANITDYQAWQDTLTEEEFMHNNVSYTAFLEERGDGWWVAVTEDLNSVDESL